MNETFNPLLPQTNELIYGGLAFVVLLVVLSKVALPAIRASLQARQDRIRHDLEAAEATRVEARHVLQEYRQQLADARDEAGRIIEESRRAADEMRQALMAQAEAQAAELRARAEADLEATMARVRADLRRQVADLAVTLAEKVVERSLDHQAHLDLVDRYIDEVDGMRAGSRG